MKMSWEEFRDIYCCFCEESCNCKSPEDAGEHKCEIFLSIKAKEFAKARLPKSKYEHSFRVCNYCLELIDSRYRTLSGGKCAAISFLHDVVEDTDCTLEEIREEFGYYIMKCVEILTHDKEKISYPAYIDMIMESSYKEAKAVKHADMKDHLSQKETLTPKLKEKYFEVIDRFI